jgi:AcrR family transcriptional regulator
MRMRGDARRNRERILAGAVEVFTARGPTASMDEVARAASVAVGTLYRHFPDRKALALDVATTALSDLLGRVTAVAAGGASGWEKLREVVRQAAGLPLALAKELAGVVPVAEHPVGLGTEVDAALAGIAEAGRRDGSIRADLAAGQILEVISVVVCRPGAAPDDALVRVVLDGLRPPARS